MTAERTDAPSRQCGCCMEPATDDTPGIDLCSEATGTFNGQAWKIKRCAVHEAAFDTAAELAALRSERFTSYRPGLEAVQTYLRGAYMTSKKAADILDNLEAFIVNELNAAPQEVPVVESARTSERTTRKTVADPLASVNSAHQPAESASRCVEGTMDARDAARYRAIKDASSPFLVRCVSKDGPGEFTLSPNLDEYVDAWLDERPSPHNKETKA